MPTSASPSRNKAHASVPAPGGIEPAAPARIAILLPRFSRYGGVEQFAYRLCEGLAARGHAVDMICARREVAAPPGVRVLVVGRPPGFRLMKMLFFLLGAEHLRKKGNYDLSVSLGKTWRQDITRMGGGPLKVFWEKSERALPKGFLRIAKKCKRRLSPVNWLTLFVEKRQFREDSEVIAVSHLVRDWLLSAYPSLLPDRVSVIYNRPDATRFAPPLPGERAALRESLLLRCGLGSLPETAVFVGTASTNFLLKGIGPLIRALAQLPEHILLFVAGGRDSGGYQKLARRLGVHNRVFFCGRIDDMPSFYKALDIFILPTFYDACSNAVLEALASGCRTLTSGNNGAAFFLEEEAVLPDPGDADEIAKRLALFAQRPPPAPFHWPDNVPSGLECFMDAIEKKIRGKN